MNEFIENKYYDMRNRIRQALREDNDDMPNGGISPTTTDGVPIRKLFIYNLASRTSSQHLTAHFSRYGTVRNCFIRKKSSNSNYAFVTFSKVEEAMSARADGERKNIILHSKVLGVNEADSWHQPDSLKNKYRPKRNNSKEQLERTEISIESYATINDSSCINTLNNDCLMHIFLYLPIVDRIRIERVCKRWQIVCKETWRSVQSLDTLKATWGFPLDNPRWIINNFAFCKVLVRCRRFLSHINITNRHHLLNERIVSSIGKACKNIQTINISGLTVSASAIYSLALNCRDVTKFCVWYLENVCEGALKMFILRNDKLRHFEIGHNNTFGRYLLFLPSSSLVELNLHNCCFMIPSHLENALAKLKNLEIVYIVQCSGISGRVMEMIGTHCSNLKRLTLTGNYPGVGFEDMLHITKLAELESLDVNDNDRVTDMFLIKLSSKCRQLK